MTYLRLFGLLLLGAMLWGGCQDMRPPAAEPSPAAPSEAQSPAPSNASATASPSASAGAPATMPSAVTPRQGQGAIMAMVNDQPVYMSELYEILLRGQGLGLAQQLVSIEMVRQEAQRQNITVTEAEFQAENDRMMKEVFGNVEGGEQRERLLVQLFAEKGLSRLNWDLSVQRNALLRKLAAPRIKITDEDLRQEFQQQFGRKVVVSHIEVESVQEAEKILQQLRDKADFAELAKKHSKNPSSARGGMLPPIGPGSPSMPAAILQVALSMKEIGEISGIVKVGYAYHVLKLDKIIEPQDVEFEAVRGTLREVAAARALVAMQQQILLELMQKGRFEFVNPTLREMNTEAARKK